MTSLTIKMKIYTKTGDKGKTSLYDGKRLNKFSLMFEVLGELDELTCRIGMLHALVKNDEILKYLRKIQQIIQDINSNIATIDKTKKLPYIGGELIVEIETKIDGMEGKLPKLTRFILPGIGRIDSQVHLCRTQTRKVERLLWKLNNCELNGKILNLTLVKVDENILKFINRLSDYFFVLSRLVVLRL